MRTDYSSRGLVIGAIGIGFLMASVHSTARQGGSAAPQGPPPAQAAQDPGPGGRGQGGGRGGGGVGRGATPVPYGEYAGFAKLWDGATFTNWDGETDVWSIENGAIHADTTKTPGQHHIHYIGPGAVMRDFDLKVEMKMSETGANGGIQYRSRLLHPAHGGSIQSPLGRNLPAGITTWAQAATALLTQPPPPPRQGGAGGNRGGGNPGGAGAPAGNAPAGNPPAAAAPPPNPCVGHVGNPGGASGARAAGGGRETAPAAGAVPSGNPWQVSGYQFDMNSANNYTGQLYEGQGRGIVNTPGGMVLLLPGNCSARIATVIENPAAAVKAHKGVDGEWNQIEIIARGNTLVHMINGQVITVTIDDNPDARASQGILSLQLEGSGQIWYRNVYVKNLN